MNEKKCHFVYKNVNFFDQKINKIRLLTQKKKMKTILMLSFSKIKKDAMIELD